MTLSRRRQGPLLVVAALALCAGPACKSGESREELVVEAVRHGRYGEAVEAARKLAEQRPGDARAARLQRDTQLAYVLDLGRKAVFRGELEQALVLFEQAHELAPDHAVVADWISKTRSQLATQWLDRAAERTGPEHLEEAELAYEKVLEYEPTNPDAIRGLSQLLLLKNYRGGMSKTYFDDGLSSFRRLLLEQARRAFQVSRRYQENEPALARGEQVETLIAEERLVQARNLEADGLFFAARNEYRLVLLVDPQNADARAGLDRMDRESRAAQTLSAADMSIRRGEYEAAEQALAEAGRLTEAQQDGVSLLHSGIEERRHEQLYAAAHSLEVDYRYPEAVAAYGELLALAPDFKDALRRKQTLEEFIRLAEEFYAKALAASDDAVAEEYLRAIHPVIWPEYKDVVERLKELEARKPARKPAPTGEDGR